MIVPRHSSYDLSIPSSWVSSYLFAFELAKHPKNRWGSSNFSISLPVACHVDSFWGNNLFCAWELLPMVRIIHPQLSYLKLLQSQHFQQCQGPKGTKKKVSPFLSKLGNVSEAMLRTHENGQVEDGSCTIALPKKSTRYVRHALPPHTFRGHGRHPRRHSRGHARRSHPRENGATAARERAWAVWVMFVQRYWCRSTNKFSKWKWSSHGFQDWTSNRFQTGPKKKKLNGQPRLQSNKSLHILCYIWVLGHRLHTLVQSGGSSDGGWFGWLGWSGFCSTSFVLGFPSSSHLSNAWSASSLLDLGLYPMP